MVLDALDECEDENDIQSILPLLIQADDLTSVKLRILVTSRPETPIYLGFRASPAIVHRQLVLDELSEDTVNQDICAFFTSNFDAIRIKHGALPADWPGDDTLKILVQRANALFIYAATVCRFLSEDERVSEQRLETFYDKMRMIINPCRQLMTFISKSCKGLYLVTLMKMSKRNSIGCSTVSSSWSLFSYNHYL